MPAVDVEPIQCWTKWIKENTSLVKHSSHSLHHKLLKQRDRKYRYTFAHGIVASCPCDEVLREVLSVLKKKSLISLLVGKDRDGDIPLQSAVKSNVNPKIIKLVLDKVPKLKHDMLQAANKKGHVPLKTAFDMRRWSIVDVLLEQCIRCGLVPHLTGIGVEPNITKGSSTLLHQAMKRGDIEYLRIWLDVCKRCKIPSHSRFSALLVPNKKRCTPWYYLLNQKVEVVQKALEVLSEFQIDINKLYCDENSKQYIPHVAYRSHNEELKSLWKRFGGRIDLQDNSKQIPPERTRRVIFDSPPPSPDVGAFAWTRIGEQIAQEQIQEVDVQEPEEIQEVDTQEPREIQEVDTQGPAAEEIQEVDTQEPEAEIQEVDTQEPEEIHGIDTQEPEEIHIDPEEDVVMVGEMVQQIEKDDDETDRNKFQSRVGGSMITPQSQSSRNPTLLWKEVDPVEEHTPHDPAESWEENNTCELLSLSSTYTVDTADTTNPAFSSVHMSCDPHKNSTISTLGVFGGQ